MFTFVKAQLFAENGLQHAIGGASRARLICAAAQCAANQGDATRTLALIKEAEAVRDASAHEAAEGIFGFPLAKQRYYAASSMIWLRDRRSLSTATENAREAITLWQNASGKKSLLDDEALAHVYLATAYLGIGEVDAAMQAVGPVLEMPTERRTSWMLRRVRNLRKTLTEKRFKGSPLVAAAHQKLTQFEES